MSDPILTLRRTFAALALLAAALVSYAPLCSLARCDLAAYASTPAPAAIEPRDRMFSPGKLFRTATRRWFGPLAGTEQIVKVTVRDADSHVIRVIESERDLAAFRALWAGLIETDPGFARPPPSGAHDYKYKLAIEWSGRGGRPRSSTWFYFPGGTIELLAIWRAITVAPLYRTPSPDAFEALLRAEPSVPDQTRQ